MAKADIGPKIGIEGAAEFKRSMSQINSQLKTLGSDMARVTSAFLENENSVQQLEAANIQLADKMALLEDKADILTGRLKAMDDAGVDPLDASYQKLLRDLYDNETEMNKTAHQIHENEAAIKDLTEAQDENTKSGEKTGGMMERLGVSVEGVGRKLGLSREQTMALSDALNGGGMSLAIAGAAAAAAIVLVGKAVQEVTNFMREAVTSATGFVDEINTVALQSGFSTDFLQGLQYASEQVDVSADSIVGSMRKLKKNLFSDSEDVRSAFATLNIIPDELIAKQAPIEDIFRIVIQGLQHVDNELVRDNLAMTLFGKSADELAGVIDDGGQKLYGLIGGYKELGYILSGEQLNSLQAVDDAFNELDNEMQAVKNQIAAEMAPALIELAQQLLLIAQSVDWKEFGSAAATAIRELTPMIIDLATAIASAANALAHLIELSQQFKNSSSNTGVSFRNDGTIRNASAGFLGSSSPINLSVNLDSQTIARATYSANRAEANRIGNHAIR